jgi:hypothetical protein
MRLCACKPLRLHNQSIDHLNPFCSEISSVAMAQFASVELASRGPTEVPMFANSPSSNVAFHSSFDPQTRGPHVAEPYLPTTPSGGMFLFGEFCLAPATRTLMKRHSPVHLGARALDILIALIEWAGRLVSSAELLAIVWPNMAIEESALRVHISALAERLATDSRDSALSSAFVGAATRSLRS